MNHSTSVSANRELLRVATALFHSFHPAGGLLRPQHVRGRCGGEFSQVSRGTGEGGARETSRETSLANGEETAK